MKMFIQNPMRIAILPTLLFQEVQQGYLVDHDKLLSWEKELPFTYLQM